MKQVFKTGRIFYGIAIIETGFQTIYYHDFPYWLLPPKHSWIPGLEMLAHFSGTLLILAGLFIVIEKKTRSTSLLLGGAFLMIFCFFYIPYELMENSNLRMRVWHNAEKELAFCSGAFVIAGCFSEKNEKSFTRFLGKLIPIGVVCFSLSMISFGIVHFLQSKDVSTMVPSWMPFPIFWTYFAGVALIGSGIAIILKIKTRLITGLLGTMIFIWFIILHIPRVIASPFAYIGSEVTSAFLALAYSGIAFVFAGATKKIA